MDKDINKVILILIAPCIVLAFFSTILTIIYSIEYLTTNIKEQKEQKKKYLTTNIKEQKERKKKYLKIFGYSSLGLYIFIIILYIIYQKINNKKE